MLHFFRKKSLAEKIGLVKEHARNQALSGKDANLVYMTIALQDFGWEDAGKHFLTQSLEERIRIVLS